jgi:hypothetical protein
MSQINILQNGMAPAVPGQEADTGPHDIVTGFSAEPTLQMAWGYGLRKAPNQDPQMHLLPTGPSGTFEIVGVNLYRTDAVRLGAVLGDNASPGEVGATGVVFRGMLEVARKGRAWVPVEVDVRDGDRAFCRSNTGLAGIWLGTGGTGLVDCRRQAVFRSNTTISADGTTRVAILEFDFTTSPF